MELLQKQRLLSALGVLAEILVHLGTGGKSPDDVADTTQKGNTPLGKEGGCGCSGSHWGGCPGWMMEDSMRDQCRSQRPKKEAQQAQNNPHVTWLLSVAILPARYRGP